jgi:hypothetical protein
MPTPAEGKWAQLFNGRDFSGWFFNPSNRWLMVDGVLTWKQAAVDLWTEKEYGDFILDLEFKCSPGCNSGVFIRTEDVKDNVQTGLEIQIWDSYGVEKQEKHHCAAVYDALAASINAEKKPGEWNRMTITAKANRVWVVLNDQLVIDMDLDQWAEAGKNPDGTKNKYRKALKDFPRKGRIGIQDHHKAVWFRNVRIQEL